MGINAVIFDWGGTLSVWANIDLLDMWEAAARRLAPDRAEELRERLIAVEAASWRRVETTRRSETLANILAQASQALGLDVAGALVAEAAERHLDAWTPHIRHDPDAPPTLRALRERGLRIGLLSNTHWPREFHEHFLTRDGLVDLIDARLYTSELPWTKPHPAAFRAALDALAIDQPSEAVFVGDRPYDDIRGAQSAGMRAVLRPNPTLLPGAVVPDATIARLPELVDVIDRWNSG
jgi:putative hydrolase of the HAD superfamily